MAILKREGRKVEGRARPMVQLLCDYDNVTKWWVDADKLFLLEEKFDGKHYSNDSILKMQKENSALLPASLKSKLIKK